MFFFILFLITAVVAIFYYSKLQIIRKLRNKDRENIAEQARSIAEFETQILELKTQANRNDTLLKIKADHAETLLKECQAYVATLRARVEQLSKEAVFSQNILEGKKQELVEIQNQLLLCQQYAYSLKERLERLDKYEHIDKLADLDAELERLKSKEKEYRAKINEHITSANLRARKIIDEANRRAEEIAGDAVNVARDFRQYEQAVQAMKNIIGGYGNQYIIPGQSLLDELAEIYGHTEAGRELKRAREHATQMVTNKTAAECDYVEPSRRDTAVTFVVDAFNGKVDSILSRSKRDNYGKLRQEILDSFTIVNLNGRAFRNARITEEYRNARLDELKWACAAQEVRMQQAEEQRKLKEQIREEEKARREYERAIKETEREESMLKKAMETAQRQLAEASNEQKARFEEKLRELEQKLQAAEEKNQRALSMAQQTKSGHVYIISNIGSFGEGIYKIGMTRRLEPIDRVKELSDASVPFDFDVHALIKSEDAPGLETMLHKYFVLNRVNKVNHRREFFRASVDEIKQQVDSLGLQAQWTLAAEARQYHETLSIEKMLAENPEAREAWIKNQYSLEVHELEEIMRGKDPEEMDTPEN